MGIVVGGVKAGMAARPSSIGMNSIQGSIYEGFYLMGRYGLAGAATGLAFGTVEALAANEWTHGHSSWQSGVFGGAAAGLVASLPKQSPSATVRLMLVGATLAGTWLGWGTGTPTPNRRPE